MPVHRLWSPRTRRYADLISCLESGLSQWIMGLDTAPLSCSLISFSQDLLSSFIGRSYSHAISIFKIFFPLSLRICLLPFESNVFVIYTILSITESLEILVNLEIIVWNHRSGLHSSLYIRCTQLISWKIFSLLRYGASISGSPRRRVRLLAIEIYAEEFRGWNKGCEFFLGIDKRPCNICELCFHG